MKRVLQQRRPGKRYLWIPGLATLAWVATTLSLFVSGPYTWGDGDHSRLVIYVSIAMTMFAIGYGLGLVKRSRPAVIDRAPTRLLKWSGILVYLPLASGILTGESIRSIIAARQDLGEAYRAWAAAMGTSFWPYFEMLSAPVAAAFIPLSLYYWDRLKGTYKLALLGVLLINVTATAATGRRSGVVYIAIISALAICSRVVGLPLPRRRRLMRRIMLGFGLLILALVPFLRYVAEARSGGVVDLTVNMITLEYPEPEHFLTRKLAPEWRGVVFSGVFYLSHGYFGLEKCLDMPFEGITFGLGQSWFLARNAERLGLPSSLLDASYDRRLDEQGYPVGLFWMTMFPWFASDLTFPGTWLLMLLFGYVYARSWESATTAGEPWAVVLFGILSHFAFSLSMSNPMQDGSGLSRTIGVLLLFTVFRRRVRRRRVRERGPAPSVTSGGSPIVASVNVSG